MDGGLNSEPIHNIEIEQQILGALLTRNELFYKISDIVKPDHFFEPFHQRVWRNIAGRISKEHIASPVTLKVDFDTDEALEDLGGPAYLANMAAMSVGASMIRDYAGELVEIAKRRKLQEQILIAAEQIRDAAPLDEVKAGLDVALFDVDEGNQETSISLMKAFTNTIGRMKDAYEGDRPLGLQTGIAAIDRRLGGLFAPDFIVLGGRPSMGKTSLATSMALRVAKQGTPVGVVSLEMSDEGLSHRILSELTGVPYFNFRKAHELDGADFEKAARAAGENAELPIEIVPPGVRDISAIMSSLRRIDTKFKVQGGLGLVLVDYLQLVRAHGKGRTEEISNVSMGLVSIAKMLNCPVVALSQLSRGVEMRDNKRPMLSDLRESGQIEQDADVVLFCYREAYYLERQKPTDGNTEKLVDWQADLDASRNVMEVITAKQRFGPIGSDMIGCAIATNRFWDLEEQTEVDF